MKGNSPKRERKSKRKSKRKKEKKPTSEILSLFLSSKSKSEWTDYPANLRGPQCPPYLWPLPSRSLRFSVASYSSCTFYVLRFAVLIISAPLSRLSPSLSPDEEHRPRLLLLVTRGRNSFVPLSCFFFLVFCFLGFFLFSFFPFDSLVYPLARFLYLCPCSLRAAFRLPSAVCRYPQTTTRFSSFSLLFIFLPHVSSSSSSSPLFHLPSLLLPRPIRRSGRIRWQSCSSTHTSAAFYLLRHLDVNVD